MTQAFVEAIYKTVSFANLKKPNTMTLDLVKVRGAWRIADIRGPSGSLRDLMKVK